ncbi:MAG: hypothetical protein ACLUEQ_00030 [Cloacibacillus evryensis]
MPLVPPSVIQDADIAQAINDYQAYHDMDTIGRFDADGKPEQQPKRMRWQQIFLSLALTEREQQIPPDFAKKYIVSYKCILAGWYYGEEIPAKIEI